jgi:hypothetical protein
MLMFESDVKSRDVMDSAKKVPYITRWREQDPPLPKTYF